MAMPPVGPAIGTAFELYTTDLKSMTDVDNKSLPVITQDLFDTIYKTLPNDIYELMYMLNLIQFKLDQASLT